MIVLAFACSAAAADDPELNSLQRNAARGQVTRLAIYWSMHVDCTANNVDVTVVTPPRHGTVEVVDADQIPRFAADSPQASCNQAPIRGKALEYRAAADYRGPDAAVVEVRYPGGTMRRDTYRIDVLEKIPEIAVSIDADPPRTPPRQERLRPRPAPKERAGPYEFDCDTPAGARSQYASPAPSRTAAVSGSVKLAEARPDAKYLSMGSVAIAQGEERAVTLKFVAYPHKPGKLDAEIAIMSGARARPREIVVASLDAREKVTFEARLDHDGVEVRVGDVVKRVELQGYEARRVLLGCSGGNYLFTDVVITD